MAKVLFLAEKKAGVPAVAGYAFKGCLQRFEFADAKRVFYRGLKQDNGFGVLHRGGCIVVGYVFGDVGCPAIF